MTVIKICGIKDVGVALMAAQAGADYLGLVFAHSPRVVSPDTAKKIVESVRLANAKPLFVGVFVNTPVQDVNRIADYCHLDCVQLSGHERWEYCQQIERPVIKVMHVGKNMNSNEIISEIISGYGQSREKRPKLLLDTSADNIFGGSGHVFDWRIAKEIASHYLVMVAGGLTPENVAQLVRDVIPWGVDVSTGVETAGQKDTGKILSFIQAVRSIRSQDVTK